MSTLKNNRRKQELLVLLSMLGIYLLVGQAEILDKHAYSNHTWRQSDAYSFTLNYFHEDLPLLKPAMHYQGSEEGKAVGEFPIVYFMAAKLWQIPGNPSPFISRLLVLVLCSIGLFYLFRLAGRLGISWPMNYFIWLIIATSPVFIFYSSTFLSNAVALSFAFLSLNAWFSLRDEYKPYKLVALLFFITMTGLLRPSMLIGVVGVYFIALFEAFDRKSLKFSKRGMVQLSLLGIPVLINLAWIFYVKQYNKEHGDGYFLTRLKPIWSSKNLKQEFVESIGVAVDGMFNVFVLIAIAICLIFSLYHFRKLSKSLRVLFISGLTLSVIYYLFWYQHFRMHDYYYLDFLPFAFICLACAMSVYQQLKLSFTLRKILAAFAILLCCYSLYHLVIQHRIKYNYSEQLASQRMVISKHDANKWKAFHYQWGKRIEGIELINKALDSLDFTRNQLLMAYPDPSPNILLSRLDMKGFTNLYNLHPNLEERVKFMQGKGAFHMVQVGALGHDEKKLIPYIHDTLFHQDEFAIYSLDTLVRKKY